MKKRQLLFFIIFLTIVCAIISFPKDVPVKFSAFGKKVDLSISSPEIKIGKFYRDLNIKKGLDLQGGSQLVLEADMSQIENENKTEALNSAKEVIARRVDLYGVSEPVIQTSKVGENYRILVELPGIENIDEAIKLIGQTAQLDFREIPQEFKDATPSTIPIFVYQPTGLTGKELKKAMVQFGTNNASGEPVVAISFNDEGKQKFAEITGRNVGKPLAIFLDEYPVTAPTVNEPIRDGQAIISGNFTIGSAKQLAIQLNAGALPVPIKILEQKTIGPTLGQESIQRSIIAGLIGLLLVMAFMLALYGKLGLFANLALIIYGLITLNIYKLIPITLTLPGIAGFILSVGMAVDANILIFERMKEELRQGRNWQLAMELGFGKAWDSIKDANLATILTALILLNPFNFQFLVTSGMVRGFALTLLIGVLISMFTGVVVTRTLMRNFYKGKDYQAQVENKIS
ncbi:protein translocase subunit SecD [Candidatus Beckwithbacteria bacterium]|nr:protein translocase subunit SecD [Candidatus Beckwithbacteria bacterium]